MRSQKQKKKKNKNKNRITREQTNAGLPLHREEEEEEEEVRVITNSDFALKKPVAQKNSEFRDFLRKITLSNESKTVTKRAIEDQLERMSRMYRIDRLGAKLALELSLGPKKDSERVFEALKVSAKTSSFKVEDEAKADQRMITNDLVTEDAERGDDEDEVSVFERVFGDSCKKVPKTDDVRFREPIEALEDALICIKSLEEKKRRTNESKGDLVSGSEFDDGDDSDNDDYDDFVSEASSLLSIGETRRRGASSSIGAKSSNNTTSEVKQQITSTSLFRDVVFAAYHVFALNDAKKLAFDKWISDDVNRLYARDLLLAEKEIKEEDRKPCAATRAEFLRVACASRAANAEKKALETLEEQFPRWSVQIQRAKRRRDVSSRIACERWVRLFQTHASEIRQKVTESPNDTDFAFTFKKIKEFTRKFDVTEAEQNMYNTADPNAMKESERVADACRAMLLDGLNAACGVTVSNLSIIENDSEYYNSDVFEKQRTLIAKECGRPLRSLEARCVQAQKEIAILTERAFASAKIVNAAASAHMFESEALKYELFCKEEIQRSLLEEESLEKTKELEQIERKRIAKLERSKELARRKIEKENELKREREELELRKQEELKLAEVADAFRKQERSRVEELRKIREIEEQKRLLEEIERVNKANRSWADFASDSEEDDFADLLVYVDNVHRNLERVVI
jgi:hypothetical protein